MGGRRKKYNHKGGVSSLGKPKRNASTDIMKTLDDRTRTKKRHQPKLLIRKRLQGEIGLDRRGNVKTSNVGNRRRYREGAAAVRGESRGGKKEFKQVKNSNQNIQKRPLTGMGEGPDLRRVSQFIQTPEPATQ